MMRAPELEINDICEMMSLKFKAEEVVEEEAKILEVLDYNVCFKFTLNLMNGNPSEE